jgi:hypothetical protein
VGQQFVLFLVLGVCVLGIAMSVHLINIQGEALQNNRDVITDGLYQIAARAQQYYMCPFEEGGGEGSFTGIPRGVEGIRCLQANPSTPYGEYFVFSSGTRNAVQFLGVGIEGGTNPSLPVRVLMTVWPDSTAVTDLN